MSDGRVLRSDREAGEPHDRLPCRDLGVVAAHPQPWPHLARAEEEVGPADEHAAGRWDGWFRVSDAFAGFLHALFVISGRGLLMSACSGTVTPRKHTCGKFCAA